ncbi:CYP4V2 [Cordylochernes scorpioides]|uniref:CYP4V2 n=1 Tax=Cordylochernes scorpioides TaxID=51811 RepID=A0ABY6K2M6_9ARAC|nr:CYP4V2 [Cordylochernes scorpioides]
MFSLSSSGPKWKSRRRMITPVFHFRVFEGYQDIVNSHTGHLVDHLRLLGPDWMDIRPVMSKCLLDAIGAAAFGIELNSLNGKSEYLGHLKNCCSGSMSIFSKAAAIAGHENMWLIKKRKKEMLEKLEREEDLHQDKKPKSFLNLLVEEHIKNNSLSIYDIEEEVQTFLFAGHDTTATGNSWTLYHLGRHPEILRKVQEEVDSVFEDDRPITAEDLKQLQYLEMVIKMGPKELKFSEARSRSRAPVHVVQVMIIMQFYFALTNVPEPRKYKIPKGGSLFLWIYHLHHNASVYPDPEKFDPERFRPGSPQLLSRHPFAFIPFSAGPRNCIGQKLAMLEQKTLVATIVKHFDIESRDHFDTLLPCLDVVLSTVQPLMLRFKPRCMDRSDLLHGQDTTTTSVGRYCDQDAWTDLICFMDKTPPPPQLAGIVIRVHGPI